MKNQYTQGVVVRKLEMFARCLDLPVVPNVWEKHEKGIFLEISRRRYVLHLFTNGIRTQPWGIAPLTGKEMWQVLDFAIDTLQVKDATVPIG